MFDRATIVGGQKHRLPDRIIVAVYAAPCLMYRHSSFSHLAALFPQMGPPLAPPPPARASHREDTRVPSLSLSLSPPCSRSCVSQEIDEGFYLSRGTSYHGLTSRVFRVMPRDLIVLLIINRERRPRDAWKWLPTGALPSSQQQCA